MAAFHARMFVGLALLAGVFEPANSPQRTPTPRSTLAESRAMDSTRRAGPDFGGVREDVRLASRFDADQDGRLDDAERGRALVEAERLGLNRGRGGRRVSNAGPTGRGPEFSTSQARVYPSTVPLFDPTALRTLFLGFEVAGWERELMAFKRTDVRVPATLTVDGRDYRDVGIQFHGNSSFSSVPRGLKHSIHVSMDFERDMQNLGGYSSFTLLNAHEDPTYLRTVLYLHIARDYIPAPRANFQRLVINGESWGVYPAQQQFNREFTEEWFHSRDGTRWKIPGSPGSRSGGLSYLGANLDAYRRAYEIKSKDAPGAWLALMNLTKVMAETPPARLEAALAPILDVDGALRFLALDMVFVNNDGYWTRGSDYNLYLDPDGRFHVLPYDANETFSSRNGRGPGFGGGDASTDPLAAATDSSKALAFRLLAVPALRAKYLQYVRDIATKWLDWTRLGPVVTQYRSLISDDVRKDAHKLDSFEEFERGPEVLRSFAARRRAVLLTETSR